MQSRCVCCARTQTPFAKFRSLMCAFIQLSVFFVDCSTHTHIRANVLNRYGDMIIHTYTHSCTHAWTYTPLTNTQTHMHTHAPTSQWFTSHGDMIIICHTHIYSSTRTYTHPHAHILIHTHIYSSTRALIHLCILTPHHTHERTHALHYTRMHARTLSRMHAHTNTSHTRSRKISFAKLRAHSPQDGHCLVSASRDHSIRLWGRFSTSTSIFFYIYFASILLFLSLLLSMCLYCY